jgi:surface protein
MTSPDPNSLAKDFMSTSSRNGQFDNETTTPTGEVTKEGRSSIISHVNNNENTHIDKHLSPTCGEADDHEDVVSILSDDIELNALSFISRNRRDRVICVLATVCLLLGSIVLAGLCGSGMCTRNKINTDEQTSFGINCVGACPSSAPSISNNSETGVPTISPNKQIFIKEPTSDDTVDDTIVGIEPQLSFSTTQELYEAVDEYLMTGSTNANYGKTIGAWNISLLTDLSNVFNAYDRNPLALYFNENLTGWDTSRVITMENLFLDARAFNGDVSTWQTGNVINMYQTFGRATSFNGDVSQWDVSKVTTINRMCKFHFFSSIHVKWVHTQSSFNLLLFTILCNISWTSYKFQWRPT